MQHTNPNLLYYRATLIPAQTDDEILFDCQAEDDAHAEEQVVSAYPDCTVLKLDPFAKWIIYSPSEATQRVAGGFWSGEGWTTRPGAKIFSGADRESMALPLSRGNDGRWMAADLFPETPALGEMKHFTLTLNVSYTPNGVESNELIRQLKGMVNHAVSRGLLTGESDAVVEEWGVGIIETPEPAMDLTESTIADWIARRIEDGELDLSDIPLLMARYALRNPSEMRTELAERMGLLSPRT